MPREFPTPVIPQARPCPVLPYPHVAEPDGLSGWWVKVDRRCVGRAFPRVVRDPEGDWFGRRSGPHEEAAEFPDEVSALAHVAGCDPADVGFEERR